MPPDRLEELPAFHGPFLHLPVRGAKGHDDRPSIKLPPVETALQGPQPLPRHQPLSRQFSPVDPEGGALGDPEGEGGDGIVVAEVGIHREERVAVDLRPPARRFSFRQAGKSAGAGEGEVEDSVGMDLVDPEAAPVGLGQVPVVAGQLCRHPPGDPRRAEELHRPG